MVNAFLWAGGAQAFAFSGGQTFSCMISRIGDRAKPCEMGSTVSYFPQSSISIGAQRIVLLIRVKHRAYVEGSPISSINPHTHTHSANPHPSLKVRPVRHIHSYPFVSWTTHGPPNIQSLNNPNPNPNLYKIGIIITCRGMYSKADG